jgi:hypothetical protein
MFVVFLGQYNHKANCRPFFCLFCFERPFRALQAFFAAPFVLAGGSVFLMSPRRCTLAKAQQRVDKSFLALTRQQVRKSAWTPKRQINLWPQHNARIKLRPQWL